MRVVVGLISGLLLGLGIALLLFSYSKLAIGTMAFPLVILIGVLVGLALGVVAARRGSASTAS